MRTSIVSFLVCAAVPATTRAQRSSAVNTPPPPPSLPAPPLVANYVGANLMGFAGFLRLNVGSFEVYYEHVFAQHHAVQLAGDFIHVHMNAAHMQSHQWTFGGSATYRYYFGAARGPFVGLNVGYRRGYGHFEEPGRVTLTNLQNEQFRVLAQVGYRITVPGTRPSFSVVPRLGVGYGPYFVRAVDATDPVNAEYAARTSRDLLAPHALVLDLEVSASVGF
jgi:hypothetical protein